MLSSNRAYAFSDVRIVVFDVWDLPIAIALPRSESCYFPTGLFLILNTGSQREIFVELLLRGDLLFGVVGFRIRLLNRLRIGGTRQEPNGVSRLNESAHQHAGRNSHGIKTMKVS